MRPMNLSAAVTRKARVSRWPLIACGALFLLLCAVFVRSSDFRPNVKSVSDTQPPSVSNALPASARSVEPREPTYSDDLEQARQAAEAQNQAKARAVEAARLEKERQAAQMQRVEIERAEARRVATRVRDADGNEKRRIGEGEYKEPIGERRAETAASSRNEPPAQKRSFGTPRSRRPTRLQVARNSPSRSR
jgi:hypothetical protein